MANRLSEIIEKRDQNSKHFLTDVPGEFQAIIGNNLHYQKPDDSWDDYDNLVHDVTGGWQADTKDVTFGIVNGYLGITYKGKTLSMRPDAVWMVDASAPATRQRKLADANYTNVTRSGPNVTVTNIFPGVNLNVTIQHDRMAKEFVIASRPTLPDPTSLGWNPATTYMVFDWDVTVPAGAVVKDTVTNQTVGYGYTGKNNLVVQDNLGNPVVYFLAGEARNANGRRSDVWYISANATVPFGEAYPYSKIMIATYPLTIDPTTTISPATTGSNGQLSNRDLGGWAFNTGTTTTIGNAAWSDGKGGGGYDEYKFVGRYDLSSLSGYSITSCNVTFEVWAYTGSQTYDVRILDSDYSPLAAGAATAASTSAGTFSGYSSTGSKTHSLSSPSVVGAKFGGYCVMRIEGTGAWNQNPTKNFDTYLYSSTNHPKLEITYVTTYSATFTADAVILKTQSGTFGADSYITAGAPTWVSPSDGSAQSSGTPLVFTSITSASVAHFEMQLDTANTFDTGNLIKAKSYVDTGWEYWDGSAWQTLTSAGMPANKTGNQVRYTPSLTGTWYRRVRQSGT